MFQNIPVVVVDDVVVFVVDVVFVTEEKKPKLQLPNPPLPLLLQLHLKAPPITVGGRRDTAATKSRGGAESRL